ncbi:MAG: serine hydrolase domain-containing protein [Pseudomonadota bacterium]
MIRTTSWMMALALWLGIAAAQDAADDTAIEPVVDDPIVSDEAEAREPVVDPLTVDLEAFVDGLMASYQATYHVPGYGVTLVDSEGTLFAKGYGYADVDAGTPVTADDTRFHVASISKTFVWVSIMMLVDRGLVDLDTDVNVYLTRFQMPKGDRPITLNDVMAHRMGLEDGFDVLTTKIDELSLTDAMLASMPGQLHPRGDIVAYSNWGTNLAAVIVADVTGMSYADFLFTEILEPLGMTGTALGTTGEAFVSIPASKNYGVTPFGPEEHPQLEQKNFAPIGGMTITPADMGKWMRFHLGRGELDGVRLLSEETYALMRERAFEGDPRGSDIAHGFSDRPFRSTTLYGHDGSINSVFSTMVIAPELNLAVFVAQNSHATYKPVGQLPHLLMDRVLMARGFPGTEIAEDAPTGDEAAAAAKEIAGRYISSRRPDRGFERLVGAVRQSTASAKDGTVSLDPQGSPFRPIGPDLWEDAEGRRMAVLRYEDGSVKGLLIGFGAAILMPVTLGTDIYVLAGAFGLTVVFLVTTYLGLWRRWGRGDGGATVIGRGLSLLALGSIFPVTFLAAGIGGVGEALSLPFGELFADYPPAEVAGAVVAASAVSALGLVLLVSVVPAWTASGWSVWRKLHHTALGLSYGALAVGLIHWGLAFSDLSIG